MGRLRRALRICILDGDPREGDTPLSEALAQLAAALAARGHQASVLRLQELEIQYCVGCFGCWVKTPGRCVFADDSARVCREVISSDLTVFASPLVMGYVSATLKRAMDKLIPLIHPYTAVIGAEIHHRRRYTRYPRLGLLLEREPGGSDEDVRLTRRMFERTAINFHSRLAFVHLAGDPPEEVLDVVDRTRRRV